MELEERIYALMMDALDGELTPVEHEELQAHLIAHPSYMAEWQAMQAIDTLFRQTPALTPTADFAQRTLARLPNRQTRVWLIGAIYGLLLVSGVLPLLLGLWVYNQLGDVLAEPAFLNSVWLALGNGLQILSAVLEAMLKGAGELILQQPAVLGWLLVMGGLVFLWGGLYRQLETQPSQISS